MATAETENNKNTITVTAPAPIAENRTADPYGNDISLMIQRVYIVKCYK